MKRGADDRTPDLFRDFTPAPVVERYAPERVRATSHSGRLARAVSEALREASGSRKDIAAEMSAYLEEQITPAMLDAYASVARETHNIPAHRLIALAVITGDARLINVLLEDTGLVAVAAKYEALIRREMAKEARARLDREIGAAEAEWRAKR